MNTSDHLVAGDVYDKQATRNPIARLLYAGYLRAFQALLPPMGAGRILEVGSGEGWIVSQLRARFPTCKLLAIDLAMEMVQATRHAAAVEGAAYASADHLPFGDRSFDLVVCVEVLEHLETPGLALREIARVSKGHVILSVPREPLWRLLNMVRGAYIGVIGGTLPGIASIGRPGPFKAWFGT